jgi:hypothetical protein
MLLTVPTSQPRSAGADNCASPSQRLRQSESNAGTCERFSRRALPRLQSAHGAEGAETGADKHSARGRALRLSCVRNGNYAHGQRIGCFTLWRWCQRPARAVATQRARSELPRGDVSPGQSMLRFASYRPRIFASTRPNRPGAAMRSSSAAEAGTIGGAGCTGKGSASLSRPCLMKTRSHLSSWHFEQVKVWRSKPRCPVGSILATFIRIISASHALQRIVRHRLQRPRL